LGSRFQDGHDSQNENTKYMNRIEKLAELRELQSRADAIRREIGISSPGTVIFFARRGPCTDDEIVVEADGFGGATTSIVEGNYPVDSVTKFEKTFQGEKEALAAAEELSFPERSQAT
jgi:hypothetical protein